MCLWAHKYFKCFALNPKRKSCHLEKKKIIIKKGESGGGRKAGRNRMSIGKRLPHNKMP